MINELSTAVVILNWNGRKLLEEFLPTVIAHTPPEAGRVIVADNGSTDSSMAYLDDLAASGKIEVMAFDRNYGFAEGYNKALARLKGRFKYAVLLNSDVAAREDWLTPLIDFMEANPDVAACAPKLMSHREPGKFEYAGASGGFLDRHGFPYCRGRIFDTCETDMGQYDSTADVDWATGAALMTRIDTYLEAGGLDPDFFAHMEEIDLCWRMRRLGMRIAVVPGARLFHLGGGSLPPSDPRKTYLNYRNNLIMLHKNLPPESRRGAPAPPVARHCGLGHEHSHRQMGGGKSHNTRPQRLPQDAQVISCEDRQCNRSRPRTAPQYNSTVLHQGAPHLHLAPLSTSIQSAGLLWQPGAPYLLIFISGYY